MSITINIYYKGKSGCAKAFAEEMTKRGFVDAVRKEEGNLRYEYFLPLDDPDTVLLIDEWSDGKALDFHHSSPIMKEIALLREKYDLHMKVETFVSAENDETARNNEFIRK